ncbi:hypothetical protein KUTeg_015727 [Tegillarca granosa]|uniref:Uncharacterized protein n=1 Tax=Tegillarca granosa TaxID=220873 RepID=A0ABQ9ERW9_TEGGR|nr:hypothetical protein KUTeg_015727 [Tegillarca granosa]
MKITRLYRTPRISDDVINNVMSINACNTLRDCPNLVSNEPFEMNNNTWYNVTYDHDLVLFYLICVGVDVSENILTGIYASRKTIVKKDTLILIKHDKCKVPRKLMGKTFLDWACYKERPYFWKRLFQSIKVENQRAEESVP